MAEEQEGVNYASVVFKANKHPPSEGQTEEIVYDEVKVQNGTTDQAADGRRRHFKRLACGLGIISVILLAGIIAVCVYIATLSHENERLEEIQKNHLTNLTNLTNRIKELSSENENLTRDFDNLTIQMSNLTQNYTVSEKKITNLTEEILNLTTQNEELKSQKKNLTEQIQEIKANINVSRAQWSIDAYCPKKNDGRQCAACQEGWRHNEPSCYVIHNGEKPEWITWEEALENCRGKGSDLAVIHDDKEKKVISYYSWGSSGIDGYWIGLRAKDGKWKWIDGSDLAESNWIDPPAEGHCAISVMNDRWKPVSCDEKQRWICKQKALSL
ncbi:hypothetical protein ABVT39_021947 [Epinephelus coioides]